MSSTGSIPRRRTEEILATALAGGATVRDAAADAKISPRTAYRRLQDPAFRARVTEIRARLVDQVIGKLVDSGMLAVMVLRNLALKASSDAVKRAAASDLLEHGRRARHEQELEERIRRLEELLTTGDCERVL
jgi:hypothetical protein